RRRSWFRFFAIRRPEQRPDQTKCYHADGEDGCDPFCFQVSLNFSARQHRRHEDKNRRCREINRAVNFCASIAAITTPASIGVRYNRLSALGEPENSGPRSTVAAAGPAASTR